MNLDELIAKYPTEGIYVLFVIAIVFSRLPYIGKVFRVVNTMIHETGHAIMAILLNGEVVKIDLFSDSSGKATTKGSNRFSSILISLVGYPFSSLTAFLIFYLFKSNEYLIPLIILMTISIINLIFWVRNLYGILWLFSFVLISSALIYFSLNVWIYIFSVLMGGVLLIDSIVSASIVLYLSITNSKSSGDAYNLKSETFIPTFFWGLLFFSVSVCFTYLSIKITSVR